MNDLKNKEGLETQKYEVLSAIFNKNNVGKIIYLVDGPNSRWKGPWYWGSFRDVDKGEPHHDKVRLKKVD